MSNTYPWEQYPLHELEERGIATLGRGNIISKKDIQSNPGAYPIYSSSARGEGLFGSYGDYMFDEEMITWSIDGGGNFFYRPKHKFSVTNVSGFMRLETSVLDYRFAHAALALQHSRLTFDYQTKAHPSVIRNLYHLPIPPLPEQKKIAEILSGIDSVIKVQLDMASKVAKQYQGILHDVFSDESSCLPQGNYLPLEELGLDISDGNYSSKYPSANEFVERGIPFIRASNMKQGTIDDNDMRFISREKHQQITKGHLKPGDILIANRGDIGKACRVPARHIGSNINAQLVRINGGKKINQSFLYHYISSPLCQALIDELTTGTALKQLPIGNLMKLPIPVPELNVQVAIGGSLDSMQRAISTISDKSKKHSFLKQAMASDLLSGRKRVTP